MGKIGIRDGPDEDEGHVNILLVRWGWVRSANIAWEFQLLLQGTKFIVQILDFG